METPTNTSVSEQHDNKDETPQTVTAVNQPAADSSKDEQPVQSTGDTTSLDKPQGGESADAADKSDKAPDDVPAPSTETTTAVASAKENAEGTTSGVVVSEENKVADDKTEKGKTSDEKVEGPKAEGDSEQLEVLVDDTQNDLDADLLNSQSSTKTEGTSDGDNKTTDSGKVDGPDGEKTDGGEAGKTEPSKSGEGETKAEDKKPDEKRLVGFV